jgi:hypothetical protein
VSQYRNLLHHFVHSQSAGEAETFWGGCGAIRRDVFIEAGRYDEWSYPRPQIEDVELGHRVRSLGHRIILRPDTGPLGGLRLGKDELRLMMLTLIYLVLGVMLLAVAQLAIGVVTLLASVLGQTALAFVFSVAELFTLGLFFYLAVRMSLAPVITFDRGRLAILDSWKITHGQFWRLLGAYVLAICCVVVVSLLALMLFGMVAGIEAYCGFAAICFCALTCVTFSTVGGKKSLLPM